MAKQKAVQRKRAAQRKPHFIKVLFGDFSQLLRIPPKFVKNFSEEHSERAILEGPTGGLWPVELRRTSEGVHLTRGWHQFVKDNSLREFEFLLFRYEGRMHFSVSVFDTSACEREDLPAVGSAISYTESLRRQGWPRKCPQVLGCHVQEGCRSERACPPNKSMLGYHHSLSRCLQLPQLDVTIKKEEDDMPISAVGLFPSFSAVVPSPDGFTMSREHQHMAIHYYSRSRGGEHMKIARGFLSQRRPVSSQERERTYEAANSFSSSFPFFIRCMKTSTVYRTFLLKVPTVFGEAHLPPGRTELVLEDPTRRTWPVKYIPGVECRLSGGWAAFARGNHLEEGDFCAFELIRPVELRVHIFRVVDEIMPLIKAR